MPRKDRRDNWKDWIEFQNIFRYITEREESRHTTIKWKKHSESTLFVASFVFLLHGYIFSFASVSVD